ncbi:MAG: LptF/LptG family permease [Spirochaetaceae bacterium]|nr:LptF/LptG family permease [Spirochaetaceae bacterium]
MTFVKYLLKKFIPAFLGSLMFFAMVLELVDILMNLWSFIAEKVPFTGVLYVMLLYLPKSISFALPISVLFASAYTLSDLYAKNELTVIFASGLPLFMFTLPILIFSIFLTFLSFWFEDRVVVPTYAKKVEVQNEFLNVVESKNADSVVVLSENSRVIYKADFYDDAKKRLTGLYILVRDDEKRLQSVIRANSAYWQTDKWAIVDYTCYNYDGSTFRIGKNIGDIVLNEPPESFQKVVVSVETISVEEARTYINYLRRAGLPTNEAMSVYYKKYSFPAVLFIVVFLSIGLSGKTRKNVLIVSLVLCALATVLFYVTQMITMLFAKFGYIPPLVGAWFPVVLFTFLSVVLLKFSRT